MTARRIEIRVLVIEDNKDDALLLKRLLLSNEEFVSVRECNIACNFKQALAMLEKKPTDLVLFDLKAADGKSFKAIEEFKQAIADVPLVIISSLKDSESAMSVLKKGILEYLIKDEISPYFLNRSIAFALGRHKALKAERNVESGSTGKAQPEEMQPEANLFIKSGSKYVNLVKNDIHYIEAKGNYVAVHAQSGKYIVTTSLSQVAEKLCNEKFVRIHRSFIVNIHNITTIQENVVSVNGTTITIGRAYKQDLMSRINKL